MNKMSNSRNVLIAILLVAFSGVATAAKDSRTVVNLSSPERTTLLKEMRGMLEALQNIAQGLADEDMVAVSDAARPLATPLKEKLSPATLNKLPTEFRTLANSLSTDFLQMSADAKTTQDEKRTLGQLSNVMAKCLACHKAYQVKVE